MPTIIFLNSGSYIIVSETLDEVDKKVKEVKNPMDTIVFFDNENRYNSDRRVVVIAKEIDYFRSARVSI